MKIQKLRLVENIHVLQHKDFCCTHAYHKLLPSWLGILCKNWILLCPVRIDQIAHVTIMARKWPWRTFMFCLEMAQKRVSVSSPQTQNDPENLEQAVSVGQQEVVKDKLDGDEKDQCP